MLSESEAHHPAQAEDHPRGSPVRYRQAAGRKSEVRPYDCSTLLEKYSSACFAIEVFVKDALSQASH